MKRALLLAYHWPPIGGPGALRPVKLAQHLEARGYEPVVITGPGESFGRWSPLDDALAREVPPGTEVHRVAVPEPAHSNRRRRRLEQLLCRPSRWDQWWTQSAVELGRKVAGDAEVIYAGLDPYQTAEPGCLLAAALGLPWVADLQDPWALDEMLVYPTGVHRRLARARMRRLLSSADAVVMNTPEASKALVQAFPEFAGKRVACIPNGYDEADFEGLEPRLEPSAFRIVHTGSMHTEFGRRHRERGALRRLLGGTETEVDFLTRSHVFLLQALERIVAEQPALADRIELHLAGVLSDADREVVDNTPIRSQLHGFLPHADNVALMRSADLLFLPMHDLAAGRRARLVPCKSYEYLASGRPLLAALPEGDARELVQRAEHQWVCAPGDVDAMVRAIRDEILPAAPWPSVMSSRRELMASYEHAQLSSQLADVFDDVVGDRPTLTLA
ncbi:MAG: glycosyltransferase [Solirubrobacteraceae bacterium]